MIVNVNEMKTVPTEQKEQGCQFYWTALEKNSCGEMVQLAQKHCVNFHCRRQYLLGAFQPIWSTVRL
jgi:hypothetical protein